MLKCRLVKFCLVSVSVLVLVACASTGEKLTDKKCSTKCHTTEKVYNKAYMPNQWKQTIISMKRFGVKVTAEEEKQILDFLVAEHGYVSK